MRARRCGDTLDPGPCMDMRQERSLRGVHRATPAAMSPETRPQSGLNSPGPWMQTVRDLQPAVPPGRCEASAAPGDPELGVATFRHLETPCVHHLLTGRQAIATGEWWGSLG